jgi:hypothetical protein
MQDRAIPSSSCVHLNLPVNGHTLAHIRAQGQARLAKGSQDARTEAGQPLVAVALIEPQGEPKKLFRVTLPGPLRLQYGTRIGIDKGPPIAWDGPADASDPGNAPTVRTTILRTNSETITDGADGTFSSQSDEPTVKGRTVRAVGVHGQRQYSAGLRAVRPAEFQAE